MLLVLSVSWRSRRCPGDLAGVLEISPVFWSSILQNVVTVLVVNLVSKGSTLVNYNSRVVI